jgi:hypothetical protein
MLRRLDKEEDLKNSATKRSILTKSGKYPECVSILLDILFRLLKAGTY